MMKNSSTSFVLVVLAVACIAAGVLIWQQHGGQKSASVEQRHSSAIQPAGQEAKPKAPVEENSQAQTPDTPGAQDSPEESLQASAVSDAQPVDQSVADDHEKDTASGEPDSGTANLVAKDKEVITGIVAKGDTAAVLLCNWLPASTAYSLLEVTRKVYPLSQIHAGQPYTIVRNPESGEMESFEYEIDSNRKLNILCQNGNFTAKLEKIEYETRLFLVEGTIRSNLFQAMTDAGEQPPLVMIIADIFAWEINFIKDLREGDAFSILVEKRYRDGAFRNYGRVLATTFTNQNTKYEAYRFADSDGHFRFFNPKGESLEKTLLKAPLPFTRVTSGYTMRRFHPIFHENRAHQGVDYGAPTGTPIKAVGSGAVTLVGWVGGYGKQVVIRHSGRLESLYSHMSNYGRGIKSGVKVRQGQVIGYVGATGNATGPHLDFRLRQNGAFINPTKVINPRVDDLDKKRLPALQEYVTQARDYFAGKRALSEYKP